MKQLAFSILTIATILKLRKKYRKNYTKCRWLSMKKVLSLQETKKWERKYYSIMDGKSYMFPINMLKSIWSIERRCEINLDKPFWPKWHKNDLINSIIFYIFPSIINEKPLIFYKDWRFVKQLLFTLFFVLHLQYMILFYLNLNIIKSLSYLAW